VRLSKKPSVQERIRNARGKRRDGAVDRAGVGERPENRPGRRLRAAMFEDLRRPVIAGDEM